MSAAENDSRNETPAPASSVGLAGRLTAIAKAPGVFHAFSRLGYKRRAKRFSDETLKLAGKTIVITGANSGIGFAAACTMVSGGAHVWLVCRSRDRGESAIELVRQHAEHGGTAELAIADMTSLDSVRRVASQIPDVPIHGLIHNAGSLNEERMVTGDGLELDMALHVVGPHLLTQLLLPRLRRAKGRIVFVSSGGMYSERFSLAANSWAERTYDGTRAYAQAKRAQVVLTSLWAERAPSMETHAMHPGWVDTPGVEQSLPRFYRATRRWLRTPPEGADTIVWLVAAPRLSAPAGSFWLDRQPAPVHLLPGTQEAPEEREALWSFLETAVSAFKP